MVPIACAALPMRKFCVVWVAALKLTLPAWSAAMVQVPAASIVTVVPLTPVVPQTAPVFEVNVTGLPEAPPLALTPNVAPLA